MGKIIVTVKMADNKSMARAIIMLDAELLKLIAADALHYYCWLNVGN